MSTPPPKPRNSDIADMVHKIKKAEQRTPPHSTSFANSPMEEDSTLSSIFTQGPVPISEETRDAFADYARCEGGPENWSPRNWQHSARTRTRVSAVQVVGLLLGVAALVILVVAVMLS